MTCSSNEVQTGFVEGWFFCRTCRRHIPALGGSMFVDRMNFLRGLVLIVSISRLRIFAGRQWARPLSTSGLLPETGQRFRPA